MNEATKELLDILEDCEYVDTSGGEYGPQCSWCYYSPEEKHARDCRLYIALVEWGRRDALPPREEW